eukprot:TRINITY_DN7422_c0_g1_i1.p1 TRINITY_DN7422_c0_g1~~TRINITY_DN7422_c0_g1_i1.p1  ORF type:complete len:648 (+),score=109.63 TRINITY_DN7422_c0_g1_i1:65-2008(+)
MSLPTDQHSHNSLHNRHMEQQSHRILTSSMPRSPSPIGSPKFNGRKNHGWACVQFLLCMAVVVVIINILSLSAQKAKMVEFSQVGNQAPHYHGPVFTRRNHLGRIGDPVENESMSRSPDKPWKAFDDKENIHGTRSPYHIGELELKPGANTENMGNEVKIATRLARYKSPASCVQWCKGRKGAAMWSPPNMLCTEPIVCNMTQYAIVLPDQTSRIYRNHSVVGRCVDQRRLFCAIPYGHDCFGSSFNEWHVVASMGPHSVHSHFIDLVMTPSRTFRITSIFADPGEQSLLQVIGYFMPTTKRQDNCNTLYCLYEMPDRSLEQYAAIPGDLGLVFCPRPLSMAKRYTLRLTYDHKLLSFPFRIRISEPATFLQRVHLTVCTVIPFPTASSALDPSLRTWLLYLQMIGYQRVIIYSIPATKKSDPINEIASLLSHFPFVIVQEWPHFGANTEALNDCILRYGPTTKWMSFLKYTSFPVPLPPYTNVSIILEEKYSAEPLIYQRIQNFAPCANNTVLAGVDFMEQCKEILLGKSPLPLPIFQPEHALSVQGYGYNYIRLKRDRDGFTKSKGVSINKELVIYQYKYTTLEEYISRRKVEAQAFGTVEHEEAFKVEWMSAKNRTTLLPEQKNMIHRFSQQLLQIILKKSLPP